MTDKAAQELHNDFYAALTSRAVEIEERYRALTPASARHFEEAKRVLPGGYTRDINIRKPHPVFVASGQGAVMTDVDGRRIVDMCFNSTSLALGHADPRVVSAVSEQMRAGSAFQAMTEKEVALAAILCQRLPSAELVRFANSGSEAIMLALRMARAHTGRDLVIKFEGSYHGIYDDVQWSISPPVDQLGSGPVAGSAGLTGSAGRVLTLPYNDADALARAMSEHGERVAAVLVEPMANRIGLILPRQEFLRTARECCDSSGAALVFDEVIAFRLGYQGAQAEVGVMPDLTVLGKTVGGGYPVGAIAGRADMMAVTQPGHTPRVTHPGTFSGNPVTMVAGITTLEAMTPETFATQNETTEQLRAGLRKICDGLPLRVTGVGPFFKINATAREIADYRDAATVDKDWERIASLALLSEGFLLTTTMRGCISTATTEAQIANFLEAFAGIVRA